MATAQTVRGGSGCENRQKRTVQVGNHIVEITVSRCQLRRWESGLIDQVKLLEARRGLSAEDVRFLLQRWIDSGSPCDDVYAGRSSLDDPLPKPADGTPPTVRIGGRLVLVIEGRIDGSDAFD